MAAKKKPHSAPRSLPIEKAIDLLRRQIEAGEKLPPPAHIIEDNDEHVAHWRTVTDGILKRIDRSWANGFFNVQDYYSGGRQAQIAKLRAYIDLLKIEIEDPIPAGEPDAPSPSRVTYNLHGDNPRVNVNSIDSSSNAVVAVPAEFWAELHAAIQQVPVDARAELQKRAEAMKDAHGQPLFRERWTDFMANAANHVTVLGPLFGRLAGLLGP